MAHVLDRFFFLLERVDELDGGQKPDPPVLVDHGLDADRGGEMRLTSAGAADEDDVLAVVEQLAAAQGPDLALGDGALGEIEAGGILDRIERIAITCTLTVPTVIQRVTREAGSRESGLSGSKCPDACNASRRCRAMMRGR